MAKVLSPQEERIEKNKGEARLSGREKRIYDSFQNTKSVVDVQRARYFTQSFKETEGQDLSLRWAKALYKIAEKIEVPKDRSWVAFQINPKARFSDGTPITADDVIFTF